MRRSGVLEDRQGVLCIARLLSDRKRQRSTSGDESLVSSSIASRTCVARPAPSHNGTHLLTARVGMPEAQLDGTAINPVRRRLRQLHLTVA
jgi:hypothetical protein